MLEDLSRSDFAGQLNTTFFVVLEPDQRWPLELVEVGPQRPSPKVDNYSLLFRGAKELFIRQSNYRIEHPAIGTLDLFLVPIGDKPEGFEYEAVINRLRERSVPAVDQDAK